MMRYNNRMEKDQYDMRDVEKFVRLLIADYGETLRKLSEQ